MILNTPESKSEQGDHCYGDDDDWEPKYQQEEEEKNRLYSMLYDELQHIFNISKNEGGRKITEEEFEKVYRLVNHMYTIYKGYFLYEIIKRFYDHVLEHGSTNHLIDNLQYVLMYVGRSTKIPIDRLLHALAVV